MPRPIPVDLILHTLVESLLELPEDHLRDLARAISAHCIDPRIVADQWCDGAGVAQHARWIAEHRLTITTSAHISSETRAMEVAIARRLADAGLALLVTQCAEDRAAASLLLDASRLVVGLERTQAGADNGTASTIANLRKMRNAAVAENDLWHGWAKTVAGIPSSHNPHDETLRDAVEKRIIAAETAPRPAHESLVASLRAELDEARDCARREVVWVPKGEAVRPTFKPGDRVVVARKADSKSCPWSNSDDEYLGRTAEVLRVDGVGDVFVAIYDDRAWFAPACLDPAPPDTRTMRERLIDRGLDPATIDAALETKLPQFIAPAEETERPQFKVGDRVRFKPQTKTGEHPSHGDEGCIDRVDDADSRLPFRVKWFALSNFATWHRPGHLTLITPTA